MLSICQFDRFVRRSGDVPMKELAIGSWEKTLLLLSLVSSSVWKWSLWPLRGLRHSLSEQCFRSLAAHRWERIESNSVDSVRADGEFPRALPATAGECAFDHHCYRSTESTFSERWGTHRRSRIWRSSSFIPARVLLLLLEIVQKMMESVQFRGIAGKEQMVRLPFVLRVQQQQQTNAGLVHRWPQHIVGRMPTTPLLPRSVFRCRIFGRRSLIWGFSGRCRSSSEWPAWCVTWTWLSFKDERRASSENSLVNILKEEMSRRSIAALRVLVTSFDLIPSLILCRASLRRCAWGWLREIANEVRSDKG